MKFKVGDFIKGKENAEYTITDEKMKKGQILEIGEYFVEIKVLEHLDKNKIGQTYEVAKYNFEECFEILKQFTKSDLKDGDIVTYRSGRKRIVQGERLIQMNGNNGYNLNGYRDDLTEKDNCTDLDIIKVERPIQYETVYERKKEILDEAEKRYLRGVIRPFRKNVKEIIKWQYSGREVYFIKIRFQNAETLSLPDFTDKTMYKNMKAHKRYTLEELRTIKE